MACLLPAVAVRAGQPAPAPVAVPQVAAACEVWARELSFADSVARHDANAFAEHVHPQGVFSASEAPDARLTGREAIVAGWAPIVAGQHLTIRWYPTSTVASPDARVVWSSGPALVIARRGDRGTPEETTSIGAFHSVWMRDTDGAWRVIFDDGVEPVPASAGQVAAFESGRRADCPSRP
jgi:ketosteroid isomerase-like protein